MPREVTKVGEGEEISSPFSLPKSYKEAKALGVNKYFTGKLCKHGHLATRCVSNLTCMACVKIYQQTSATVKETTAKYNKKYRTNLTQKQKEKQAEYHRINRQKNLNRSLKWQQDNPDKVKARNARRRATKLNASPSWVSQTKITLIYTQAEYVQRLTKIDIEVDHIIPLNNKNVCGLHVPWNLQLLTAEENQRKGNRFVSG